VQKTRRQILDLLKLRGRATLEELAREIGLSPVTIRSHLSLLERDDLIASEEERGRVGRPHFVYFLAEGAEEQFPRAYHEVARRFLEGFRVVASPDQMDRLIEVVAERWAAERAPRLEGKGLQERVAEVARIRTEEGAMAEWESRGGGGFRLRQRHCPASRVAAVAPELCRVELRYLERLLGVAVVREGPDGRGSCSYLIGG